MNKVSCISNSEDIRIYIDGILHLRIPRDPNLKLQSWIEGEGHTRMYIIEIRSAEHSDKSAYKNKDLWKNILYELNRNI